MRKMTTRRPEERYAGHPRIYAAYGSNLDKAQMRHRCPDAEALGRAYLPDHRLTFSYVANVEPCKGEKVPVGLWRVSAADIAALDRYEGYPRSYAKRMAAATIGGERVELFWYVFAQHRDEIPPGEFYYDTLEQGYRDFGLPTEYLEEAYHRALLAADPDRAERWAWDDDDYTLILPTGEEA